MNNSIIDLAEPSRRILIKYPSRDRPDLFKERVLDWQKKAYYPRSFVWVFTFDENDASMNNDEMRQWIKDSVVGESHIHYGTHRGKIHAINDNVNDHIDTMEDIDIVMICSDDMVCNELYWDTLIGDEFDTHGPDGDFALHMNDGVQGRRLCTLSCMGVKYYRKFGYLYHPDYESCFADDEYTQIMWSQRRAAYIDEVWFRHKWVGFDGGDRLHQHNHAVMQKDQPVFELRAKYGFPANKSVLNAMRN